ncbi:MAG: ABC transporter ATP-binding protein [Tetrasphaera sp.]
MSARDVPAAPRAVDGADIARLAVASLLVLVASALELALPWPVKVVIDNALGQQPLTGPLAVIAGWSPVWLTVAAALTMVAMAVGTRVTGYASGVFAIHAAESIGHRIRIHLLGNLIRRSPRFHDRHRSSDLVSRLTIDVYRYQNGIVAWWETAIPESLFVLGTLVVLWRMDAQIALAAVVVCPLLYVVVVTRRRAVRSAQTAAREAESEMTTRASDLLRNVTLVQAYRYEQRGLVDFTLSSDACRRREVRVGIVDARLAPLGEFVLACGSAIVLILAVAKVRAGTMSLGELTVALAYLGSLYAPIRELSRMATLLAKARASKDRLDEVLQPGQAMEATGSGQPVLPLRAGITIDHIGFAYSDASTVLDDVSLNIPAGKVLAIVGATGTGKSTLLALLLRFNEPDRGRICWDGIDIRDLDIQALRRQVAFVPQESWFLDASIGTNIAMGNTDCDAARLQHAAEVGWVDEFVSRLPDGFATSMGEGGLLFSGGQRRRIAIARAVAADASVVLLDEPTAGLDNEAAAVVMAAVADVCRGRTVVIVTHDLHLAATADRVVDITQLEEGGACHGQGNGQAVRRTAEPSFVETQPQAQPQAQPSLASLSRP